ncbi:MAG: FUSC family protein, partial [Desulfobacterales bacterium]
RESFAEVQSLDLNKILPNLKAMCIELDMRFEAIERMLSGKPAEHTPQTVTLKIDLAATSALAHFPKAAVTVIIKQLNGLEVLSRSLFYSVRDIKGYGRPPSSPVAREARAGILRIDPDRLQAALKTIATLWAAFLVWFYIDPPGHSTFVEFATIIAMGSAMVGLSPVTMFTPFIVLTLAAGVLYIFVMPHLSGFTQLGVMLFSAVFAVYYLFWQPRQGLSKSIGAAMLLNIIGVQNQQTYNFAGFANTVVMIAVASGIAILIWYVPPSPHPEKVFLRLLARFYRQSEFLISRMAMDWTQKPGLVESWKLIFYQNDLLELPQKLRALGGQIDQRLFPGATPEQIQAMVNSLQALALRLKDMADMRKYPQATFLVQELLDDVRSWRMGIQELFQRWSKDPAAEPDEKLQNKLSAKLNEMEKRLNQTLSQTEEKELRDSDYQNFYRLVGSYRGLSESIVEHANLAGSLNWQELEEERF